MTTEQTNVTILIAEDDEGHTELILEQLRNAGVSNEIIRFRDGQELWDYLMAQWHNLPVIMLTTTDDPREIESCYTLGCNCYITKPMEYERFAEMLKRLGLFLMVVQTPKTPRPEGQRT